MIYKAIKVNGVKRDEHRHIMEEHIGRKLKRDEVVHHIDGDKRNNVIENLQLMSLSEHSSLHLRGNKRGTKAEHGTCSRYSYGCRCDLCRKASTDNRRKNYSPEKRREKFEKHGY
jgi:hypothetical protein